MPERYVLIRIPKTGTTWLSEVVLRLDVLAMRRAGSGSPFEMGALGRMPPVVRVAGLRCPVPDAFRYRFNRSMRKMRKKVADSNQRLFPRFREPCWRFMTETTGLLSGHLFWVDLPAWMRAFPVVATLREVLSWHLSRWLHITSPAAARAHWEREGFLPGADDVSRLPSRMRDFVEQYMGGELSLAAWCNLRAEAYWRYALQVAPPVQAPGVGLYTLRLLTYLHRDPPSVLRLSEPELEEYFASGRWRGDLCRGWFLRHERLVEDAHRVLVGEIGYHREDLERVLAGLPQRLNEAEAERRERAAKDLYGNEALCAQILHAERFALRYLLPGLTEEVSTVAAPPVDHRVSPGMGA